MRSPPSHEPEDKLRLDRWLWAARFYKTRGLSSDEIDKGRVRVNGQPGKPGRVVRAGDLVEIRSAHIVRTVIVLAISGVRGPASEAALLYRETPESVASRLADAEQRRLAPDPALTLAQGRPSKKDRRTIDRWQDARSGTERGGWNDRWSASLDD